MPPLEPKATEQQYLHDHQESFYENSGFLKEKQLCEQMQRSFYDLVCEIGNEEVNLDKLRLAEEKFRTDVDAYGKLINPGALLGADKLMPLLEEVLTNSFNVKDRGKIIRASDPKGVRYDFASANFGQASIEMNSIGQAIGMAELYVKQYLKPARFNWLLARKVELQQTIAKEEISPSLHVRFQPSSVRKAQRELQHIEKELKPLYAQIAIADKFKEGFSKQKELDVGRVFNNNLGNQSEGGEGEALGAVSYPYFPNSKDFKGKNKVGSFSELQEYTKWMVGEIYSLIFDKKGDFLPSYKGVFEGSKFQRYKNKPGELKAEIIKSILVCTVPQNDPSQETLIKLGMQNDLFKNGLEKFNEPNAFNLKALERYLDNHFKNPETRQMFDAFKELEGMKTDGSQIKTDNHSEIAPQVHPDLVHPETPQDTFKNLSSNFLFKAFSYLTLLPRAIYFAAKMVVSYFQKSDLDHYNPEKGLDDAPSSVTNPGSSFAFFASAAREAESIDSHPQLC